MAGRLSLPEVDLSCPICCDIFQNPVVLKCSHSFCASCLEQYWARRVDVRDCPLCRRRSLDEPVPSLTLKNLCDAYVSEGGGDEAGPLADELYADPTEMCPLHGERLKLFCLPDEEPICVVCHSSRKHKGHDCCPVSEAVSDLKEHMQYTLSSLQEKKEAFEKMRQNYEDTAAHIQAQVQFVERRTREEFEMLHRFLEDQERARMAALKKEEEEKSRWVKRMMEEATADIDSLSDRIRAVEEEMALEGVALLHKSKSITARAQCPVENPVMAKGTLIDVAKYLASLNYTVWKEMKNMVTYTPVTLNPNTAAPWLKLSDDLTSLIDSDDRQKLPNNPERFDPDTGVLGHRGFTSGRHVWDVEVGENTAWVLGVAKESVQRKEKVSSVLKNGYLSIYFYHNMYFAGTSPLTRLNLKRKPERIRVQLDCDKGRLSFCDPVDDVHIYTFKHAFTEKVFPYFWVGCKLSPLKIEPLEIFLKTIE